MKPIEDILMNPSMATIYDWPLHPDIGEPIQFEPIGRNGQSLHGIHGSRISSRVCVPPQMSQQLG